MHTMFVQGHLVMPNISVQLLLRRNMTEPAVKRSNNILYNLTAT
jgi:hypothetical protein